MTPEQVELWLEIQHRQMVALERIAETLDRMAPTITSAPNYQCPLETFATFDWSSIGAKVERSDHYGAAIVSWRESADLGQNGAAVIIDPLWVPTSNPTHGCPILPRFIPGECSLLGVVPLTNSEKLFGSADALARERMARINMSA